MRRCGGNNSMMKGGYGQNLTSNYMNFKHFFVLLQVVVNVVHLFSSFINTGSIESAVFVSVVYTFVTAFHFITGSSFLVPIPLCLSDHII